MTTPADDHRPTRAAALALASAVLFGISAPVAKLLLDDVSPWLLAGLLYLGSGLGLAAVRGVRAVGAGGRPREAGLGGRDWLWLAGAIAAGGVVAPVLLMAGLSVTAASTASLLLNIEGVLTALVAWFVFRENVDRRIALGMAAIVGGAALLSWPRTWAGSGTWGPAMIVLACLAWALDNNLTRKVALSDPVQVAMLKGLVAGGVNVALALALGAQPPTSGQLAAGAILGFLSYGISLVLFVLALRHLGTARTGAYYSIAPFIGAAVAVAALGEPISWGMIVAGLLMALGVWLHLTERHEHDHVHEPVTHRHLHRHDEHHRHVHGPDDPSGEPHTHRHVHVRLRHRHAHYPDAHHRHGHR
jgi:drug/metabolite transporter (DMT)-like permease